MGLFDRLRGKESNTNIYAFTFKIASGATQIPPPMIGAYVVAYATGETPTQAAERAWSELRSMGYVVEDMKSTGGALPIADWDTHVRECWPEFPDHFPRQSSLLSVLDKENAVFGPFAGFENPETAASTSSH